MTTSVLDSSGPSQRRNSVPQDERN